MTSFHTPDPPPTTSRATQRAILAMQVGTTLTIAATIVPFADRATADALADHVRAMYPDYSDARVSSSVTAYVVYLTIVGALGIAAWLWTIRTARRRPFRARILATVMLLLGGTVAVANLFIQEQTGDRAFPLLYGIAGVLPIVPGLVAVAMLWKAGSATRRLDRQTDRRGLARS